MSNGKAIITGDAIVGAAILAHLAYTVVHDHSLAVRAEQERQEQSKSGRSRAG
jgi:hypothetical protein